MYEVQQHKAVLRDLHEGRWLPPGKTRAARGHVKNTITPCMSFM